MASSWEKVKVGDSNMRAYVSVPEGARRVPGIPQRQVQRELAHSLRRSSKAHFAYVVRGVHRRKPTHPQRSTLGTKAGHDADHVECKLVANDRPNLRNFARIASSRIGKYHSYP